MMHGSINIRKNLPFKKVKCICFCSSLEIISRNGGNAPFILIVGITCRWVVSFTLRMLYPWGERASVPHRRAVCVKESLWVFEKKYAPYLRRESHKIPPKFSPYWLRYVRSWSTHEKFRLFIQLYPTDYRRPKVTDYSSPNAIMSKGGGPGIFTDRVFYFSDLSTDKCVYRLMY